MTGEPVNAGSPLDPARTGEEHRFAGQQGFALITVLFAVLILATIAASIMATGRTESRLSRTVKEYSEAAHSMCQGGKYLGCEIADGAQIALQTLKDARRQCGDGNQASCDQIAEMAPQIAAQTTDVCSIQIEGLPKAARASL